MIYRTLKRESMAVLVDRLKEGGLVAPVREDGVVVFRPIQGDREVASDYINPTNSVKDVFLPQTESLFRFNTAEKGLEIEATPPEGPKYVLGVRPCDAAALELLDHVFAEGQYTDSYYQRRRAEVTVIGVACDQVGESCFCTAFGLSPGHRRGADVMMYRLDDESYLVAFEGERGHRLAEEYPDLFGEAPAEETIEAVVTSYQSREVPAGRVELDGITEKLDGMFEHPLWAKLAARCLKCGICTYLCPTCHCFCLDDEALGYEGVRYRCWDSCMYPDYTLMAGGHNPRPEKANRTRQRFMHKLNYFVHNHGEFQCVGCGRCVDKCPVGLHMLAVIYDIKGVDSDGGQ